MEGDSKSFKIKLLRLFFKIKSVDELIELIEAIVADSALDESLKQLLMRLPKVSKKTVEEVMVPRVDMVTVQEDTPAREIINIYKKHKFSRMPVISERSDRVKGVLYIKELIRRFDEIDKLKAKDLAKEPHFVPDSIKVLDALRDFQAKSISIGLVIDEFGSVIGLVTLEDLLEEIVGEIWEEYDEKEILYYHHKKGDKEWYTFSTRIDLDEFNKIMNANFEAEDVHTLGGLIISKLERVPGPGETFEIDGFRFEVIEATRQRVKKVKVERITESDKTS